MKKLLLLFASSTLVLTSFAQVNPLAYNQNKNDNPFIVENHSFGLKTGWMRYLNYGVSGFCEFSLANRWTLYNEIYLSYDTYFPFRKDFNKLPLTPGINIEPRWYFNIQKRSNKDKWTANNASNFLSFRLNYHHRNGIMTPFHEDNVLYSGNSYEFNALLMFGMRRNLTKHIFFEGNVGLGIQYVKEKGVSFPVQESITPNVQLDLRFGINWSK
ncbi:hypothetical protein [Salibacter halophilus]|uniref:DUF3575 domain-containing protein n=1 Tax=Salibacter halophilus TaxID=1803916 RepID=A0A6N6M9D2_9FLAO|nr:hypothetical protein [Salibacter halophilus]KAB1065696.1 hypothetical protein F3059_03300 [Salibacter halophilus]